MPWLVMEPHVNNSLDALLFVHVPRCGGTSLTKHFKVLSAAMEGPNCFKKLTLIYFGYRYRVLETANFPWKTYENLYALCVLCLATGLLVTTLMDITRGAPFYAIFSHAIFVAFSSTFMFTAPALRSNFFRRFWLLGLECICAGSHLWMYGANTNGLLIHLTAPRMLHKRFVTREELSRVSSFAIVRNPFSRMVSIYMYNRFGPCESFEKFVRRWQKSLAYIIEKRARCQRTTPINEWEVYCHLLPMHEYTHNAEGEQLVQFVIKQEELRSLQGSTPSPSVKSISPALKKALLSMPHTNARKRDKHWKDYYDAETEKIVLAMYHRDFELFGYAMSLETSAKIGGPTSSDPPPGGWPEGEMPSGGDLMEDVANSFKSLSRKYSGAGSGSLSGAGSGSLSGAGSGSLRTMPNTPVSVDKMTMSCAEAGAYTPPPLNDCQHERVNGLTVVRDTRPPPKNDWAQNGEACNDGLKTSAHSVDSPT